MYFFVGAGLPHAIGAGCFVVEVQEPSDITVGAERLCKRQPDVTEEEEAAYDNRLLDTYIYDGCTYEENLKRWLIDPSSSAKETGAKKSSLSGLTRRIISPAPASMSRAAPAAHHWLCPDRHRGRRQRQAGLRWRRDGSKAWRRALPPLWRRERGNRLSGRRWHHLEPSSGRKAPVKHPGSGKSGAFFKENFL